MNTPTLPGADSIPAHTGQRRPTPRCGRPRLVAFDYDGTLTTSDRPSDETLAALARLRADGVNLVLTTGRILDELLAEFADVADHFNALVVENGAVVEVDGRRITTAPSLDPALSAGLTNRGVKHRTGEVIIATGAAHAHLVLDELARLGLECQLVHNRSELMVLPSGVNKALGLSTALAALGISPHDTIAVGDAENDHSLLSSAELGIAVANAVDSLREVADVTLDEPDGDGIRALIDDLTAEATVWRRRKRPQITIGDATDIRPVRIPAHPANIVVTGGSGDGKSFLAGLIAEQLIDLGYSVLVIDPEGDHVGLDALRPAVVLGDDGPPPQPDIVVNLLKPSDASIVLDLSTLTPDQRRRYLTDLPARVEACRRANGRPHWVVIDEAHDSITDTEAALGAIDLAGSGYCLITWKPDQLPPALVAGIDTILALTTDRPDSTIVDLVAAVGNHPRPEVARLLTGPTGSVVVATRKVGPPQLARIAPRHTEHFRHEHKYDVDGTPPHRAFRFRDEHDRPTGVAAHNLHELEAELAHCDRTILRHHAPLGDFSRWIGDVFHDRQLAASVAAIEATLTRSSSAADLDTARLDLIQELHRRHHRSTTPSEPPSPVERSS